MDEQSPPLDLKTFKAFSVLGRGAKGIAFLVKTLNETLALKVINKASIERKKKRFGEEDRDSYRRVWFEREVLGSLHHPLLPKLRGFVVTEKIIGFAIDYCSGGNLTALRKKQSEKMFSDHIIRSESEKSESNRIGLIRVESFPIRNLFRICVFYGADRVGSHPIFLSFPSNLQIWFLIGNQSLSLYFLFVFCLLFESHFVCFFVL